MADESQWVIDTKDDNFQNDVFERSKDCLVVVDFWAEWCAPCRALAPVLVALAEEMQGKFILVKANTDDVQQVAGQFGVSSIPAVFAVLGGEVIDSFQGALPEPAIREWLEACFSQSDLMHAKQLTESEPEEAEKQLRKLIDSQPKNSQPTIALLELLADQGRDDEARELLENLQERGFLEPEAERILSRLDIKSKSSESIEDTVARAEAEPDNYALQFELAEALAANDQHQECCEVCLQLVAKDRQNYGEEARKLMLKVFQVLPEDSELTREYRRKLSLTLY